uniref:Endoplasmic reticulum lectin 1 n=1 Tax=Acrobeloides nanus TaxID=290746 RepID=A0A914EMG4_9BILA
MSIVSADNEKYECVLPIIESQSKKKIEQYTGPTPSELLKPLYDERTCSYRIESYWIYELCHGRYINQYHEEKETKIRTEYYLGNFRQDQSDEDEKTFDQLNPPTKKIEGDDRPYFPVHYRQGTICDLTGKPRMTTVIYVCEENAKNPIQSLSEISTCTYEIVVLTSRLCSHPSFQPPPVKQHEIVCYADKDKSNAKPISMIAMEKEVTDEFFREYSSFDKAAQTPAENIPKPSSGSQTVPIELHEQELKEILDALKALRNVAGGGKSGNPLDERVRPTPGAEEAQIIQDFWAGRSCLYGGSGWWKYEFCYGRKVIQYHEEVGKERIEILLGTFNEKLHREWAKQHSYKIIKKEEDRITQVSNLYTGGAICEETGAHRSCEVRLRCREVDEGGSYARIVIYLLEPHTCEYVLVVESALFCEGLQHVDENGLQIDMPNHVDSDFVEEGSAVVKTIQIPKKASPVRQAPVDSEEADDEEEETTTKTHERPEI